jgi:arginine/lysine/ornithine decarboxylase
MGIGNKIRQIINSDRELFTTPSHDKGTFIIPSLKKIFGKHFFKYDLSEINDLDNLAFPDGVIAKSLKKSADILNVSDVFYLINGASSGIIASMMASLKQNDRVLIAKNCHKSVLNGLVLTGAIPVWFMPDMDCKWGIFKSVLGEQVEKILSSDKNIKAVIITSPTYEGVSSDISIISDICHKYNTILIVDEAHGALKSFAPDLFGLSAIQLGADLVVQSLHKTCGAPNPSAILLSNGTISRQFIQNAINLINTSSPSYPTIVAIEETIKFLASVRGKKQIYNLYSHLIDFRNALLRYQNVEICNFNDVSKIFVSIKNISGYFLSDLLFDKFGIEDELSNNFASLLLTGIGTSFRKLKKLQSAIGYISDKNYYSPITVQNCPLVISEYVMSPRDAYFADKKLIPLKSSVGCVCAEVIVEYPPGIPILILGEKISAQHIEYLKNKKSSIYVVR